jgi:hypothetical protein
MLISFTVIACPAHHRESAGLGVFQAAAGNDEGFGVGDDFS